MFSRDSSCSVQFLGQILVKVHPCHLTDYHSGQISVHRVVLVLRARFKYYTGGERSLHRMTFDVCAGLSYVVLLESGRHDQKVPEGHFCKERRNFLGEFVVSEETYHLVVKIQKTVLNCKAYRKRGVTFGCAPENVPAGEAVCGVVSVVDELAVFQYNQRMKLVGALKNGKVSEYLGELLVIFSVIGRFGESAAGN